jgi:hypothetical protein
MHDIDRTLMEYESGTNGYEGEYEGEFDDAYEYEFEGVYEEYDEPEVFNEEEEMDLAAELLSVTDDEELDQFLGKLIKKGFSKVRKFAKSSTGRALGGLLKGVAKKSLAHCWRGAWDRHWWPGGRGYRRQAGFGCQPSFRNGVGRPEP